MADQIPEKKTWKERRYHIRRTIGVILICFGIFMLVSSALLDLAGYSLLVAAPSIDKTFDKAVVLVERGSGGAVGVELNHEPLTAAQQAELPTYTRQEKVEYGGPVGFPQRITILIWKAPPGAPQAVGHYELRLLDEDVPNDPDYMRGQLAQLEKDGFQYRIFAGYASWRPIQLEKEVWLQRVWHQFAPEAAGQPLSKMLAGTAEWDKLHD